MRDPPGARLTDRLERTLGNSGRPPLQPQRFFGHPLRAGRTCSRKPDLFNLDVQVDFPFETSNEPAKKGRAKRVVSGISGPPRHTHVTPNRKLENERKNPRGVA
jgi:hypothetical protein